MNIGFLISVYDEIEIVNQTVATLNENNCSTIIIQSDPNDPSKLFESSLVDIYKKLSDVAGSKEQYVNERENFEIEGSSTPVKAITRNLKVGFSYSQSFHVDWWVVILGDVLISNLIGIKKIILKMTAEKKSIGITKAVGQTFMDNNNNPTRIQYLDTTDFMPQFFLVKSDLIKNGLFSNFKITNPFATEQCLGDEVSRYCLENNFTFDETVFVISDYAYPQYVTGLKYNPDRIRLPKYVDGFVNFLRKLKTGKQK
jgi:hypothetical protein